MVSNLAVAGISFRNEILSLLQESDIAALRPHLNHVTLTSNQVLHEANGLIADVYFVEEGVVSLAADMLDNGRVEVGLTGHEGLVGVSAILSSEPYSAYRAFTQVAGAAYRMNSTALRFAIEQSATRETDASAISSSSWFRPPRWPPATPGTICRNGLRAGC